MKKIIKAIGLVGMMVCLVVSAPRSTSAISLQVAPLEYRTTLKQAESQKGFIDISNPTQQPVRIHTSVQAFRQIDDHGTLQFYDDERVTAGVRVDLDEFELGAHEAVRMYFQVDGAKLPSGDVFAAIFFTTEPVAPTVGVGQSIRLGTLLSIINGTPGSRTAELTALNLPWFQLDDHVTGSYTIKNTADPSKATGFYPSVQVRTQPFGEDIQQKAKLIFAGRSRQNDFSLSSGVFGLHRVSVSYQGVVRKRWVLNATPPVLIGVVVGVLCIGVAGQRWRRRQRGITFRS